jgi:hypothetical protein
MSLPQREKQGNRCLFAVRQIHDTITTSTSRIAGELERYKLTLATLHIYVQYEKLCAGQDD